MINYLQQKIKLKHWFFNILILLALTNAKSQNINNVLRDTYYYQGQTCANVWGYVDSLGNEYALVGASQGMSIVNVTNPDSIWQVKQIPGPNNLWKEVRTYKHYAYCTSEGGNGLQIINLRNLPDTNLAYHYWAPTVGGLTLNKIHALHIDTATAYIYLYGCNTGFKGTMIAKLNDPYTPTYRGKYQIGNNYVHDGIVRNNMMYASQIFDGTVTFVDVSVDSLPQAINIQHTPGNFTHNTWLSDDDKFLFTTDEVNNSYLACYNVEDVQNISFVDRIQSNPGSSSVVHNTYYNDGYCFTSWYRDGYTIVDALRPHNLILVGNYDAYDGVGGGMNGTWGVYPYLPSGNVLLTNIDSSQFSPGGGVLTVVTPTLVRACYLEGLVTDSISNFPLNNVTISAVASTNSFTDMNNTNGTFATGTVAGGTYNITFSKSGYVSKTFSNVVLQNATVTNLQVRLFSDSISQLEEFLNSKSSVSFHVTEQKELAIKCSDFSSIKGFKMLDARGSEVLQNQKLNSSQTVDLSGISGGVYFIVVNFSNAQTKTFKIVL